MSKEEIKEPENYKKGGLENITKSFTANMVGVVFMISLIVWVITSLYLSVVDIFSGEFEHGVLSYSFIGGILTSGYMVVTNYITKKKLGIKTPKTIKKCNSCGKNTTKK